MAGISRRAFTATSLALALHGWAGRAFAAAPPVARVICDNDFSGDPDGLFQLAHHVLSPSVDIPLIVGSHLPGGNGWGGNASASDAATAARDLLRVMHRDNDYRIVAGSETAIAARDNWQPSPATKAIVAEAMRTDAAGPLVYCAGASLTELALAWLAEPRIGKRIRLIWIGGNEHPGLASPPPKADPLEFNLGMDPLAAQIIFNESDIEIWQVPRDAYRQMLFSYAELAELAEMGPLGRYLSSRIDGISEAMARMLPNVTFPRTETYILGDSPLVTLTALQSFFQTDPSSSAYSLRPTPRLLASGGYAASPRGRPMRVYTRIDSRLTFADMKAKFRVEDRRLAAATA
ncbi:MAG: nucleoside hydrolase [Novosphingobium sp.]